MEPRSTRPTVAALTGLIAAGALSLKTLSGSSAGADDLAFLDMKATTVAQVPEAVILSNRPHLRAAVTSVRPSAQEAAANSWPHLAAAAGALTVLGHLATRRRSVRAGHTTSGSVILPIAAPAVAVANTAGASASASAFAGSLPQQQQRVGIHAKRGMDRVSKTTRSSRVIRYNKNMRGPYAVERRKEMWLNFAKGFPGRSRKCFRFAKQMCMRVFKRMYSDRRVLKRRMRTLWIMRVNANCKLHGITYSHFICRMKEVNININRKIMSQLGVYDRALFTNIVNAAVPEWKAIKEKKDTPPKVMTVEEEDSIMIPYIERNFPDLYSDSWCRFNRQVNDFGVTYTVDVGNPEVWREVLPKMPELANFQVADHLMQDANAQHEEFDPRLLNHPSYVNNREKREYFTKLVKKATSSGDPNRPQKEGVSRADWFKKEKQTWF